MSLSAKRISIFKTEIPAGQHQLTIVNCNTHKKSSGELITNNGSPGVVFTFENQGLLHQEIYWVEGFNYKKLQEILGVIGVDPTYDIVKKDLIGKMFWGKIVEYKTMRGVEEIRNEKKLTDVSGKRMGESDYVIYKEEKFNPEDAAF